LDGCILRNEDKAGFIFNGLNRKISSFLVSLQDEIKRTIESNLSIFC
jgi:hypothetical protein